MMMNSVSESNTHGNYLKTILDSDNDTINYVYSDKGYHDNMRRGNYKLWGQNSTLDNRVVYDPEKWFVNKIAKCGLKNIGKITNAVSPKKCCYKGYRDWTRQIRSEEALSLIKDFKKETRRLDREDIERSKNGEEILFSDCICRINEIIIKKGQCIINPMGDVFTKESCDEWLSKIEKKEKESGKPYGHEDALIDKNTYRTSEIVRGRKAAIYKKELKNQEAYLKKNCEVQKTAVKYMIRELDKDIEKYYRAEWKALQSDCNKEIVTIKQFNIRRNSMYNELVDCRSTDIAEKLGIAEPV